MGSPVNVLRDVDEISILDEEIGKAAGELVRGVIR